MNRHVKQYAILHINVLYEQIDTHMTAHTQVTIERQNMSNINLRCRLCAKQRIIKKKLFFFKFPNKLQKIRSTKFYRRLSPSGLARTLLYESYTQRLQTALGEELYIVVRYIRGRSHAKLVILVIETRFLSHTIILNNEFCQNPRSILFQKQMKPFNSPVSAQVFHFEITHLTLLKYSTVKFQ